MTRYLRNFTLLILAILAGGIAAAQEKDTTTGVPAEHHPWGRFPVGSWKRTRVTAEVLDTLGNVVSTSIYETKTTLKAADSSTYTLRSEVITESSGKRFIITPQTIAQGYSGNAVGETVVAKKTGEAEVEINGRKIPCQVRQISIEGKGTKYEGTVYVNAGISPYVLRKEGTAIVTTESPKVDGPKSEGTKWTTSVEVIALVPVPVLADRRNAAVIRTIERKGDRTITTVETTCDDIPGGEVARSTQEQNAEHKILRRTTLELLDYSIGNEQPMENWGGRVRVRHRSRPRRADDMQSSPCR